jgi:uncharacterized membrane protein (GlpM family)
MRVSAEEVSLFAANVHVRASMLLVRLLLMGAATAVVAATTGLVQVVMLTALIAVGALSHIREITHPLTWFSPVFWLYSAAFPILAVIGIYEYDQHLQFAVTLHAVAYMAFSIPLLSCSQPLRVDHWDWPLMSLRRQTALVLLLGLMPLVCLLVARVASLGVGSKRELIDMNSGVVSVLISALTLMTFVYCVYLICAIARRDRVWLISSLVFGCFGATIIMVGERDYLLRALVMSVLIVWDFYRRPKFPTIALLGLLVVGALPWLQSLKASGLGGNEKVYEFQLASLLSQEFRVAAQNTHTVLVRDVDVLAKPGEVIGRDLVRAVSPKVLGFKTQSTTGWFNQVIYFDVESGRGFSFVAYGFLIGGVAGVALLYGAMGLIYRLAYKLRGRSYLWLAAYVLMAPLWMYTQRGDLSTWLAQMLRSIGLLLFLFAAAVFLIRSLCGRRRLEVAGGDTQR